MKQNASQETSMHVSISHIYFDTYRPLTAMTGHLRANEFTEFY